REVRWRRPARPGNSERRGRQVLVEDLTVRAAAPIRVPVHGPAGRASAVRALLRTRGRTAAVAGSDSPDQEAKSLRSCGLTTLPPALRGSSGTITRSLGCL